MRTKIYILACIHYYNSQGFDRIWQNCFYWLPRNTIGITAKLFYSKLILHSNLLTEWAIENFLYQLTKNSLTWLPAPRLENDVSVSEWLLVCFRVATDNLSYGNGRSFALVSLDPSLCTCRCYDALRRVNLYYGFRLAIT